MTRLIHNIRTSLLTRYPLHGSQRYNAFFIVGAPRSGTTLMRRILTASPRLHIPPETKVMGQVVEQWKKYQNLSWPDLVTLALGTFSTHNRKDHFDLDFYELFLRIKKWKSSDRNLAAVIDAIVRYHAEVHNVDCFRWADKSPGHSTAMEEILQAFPDARFIHMQRDGVDSIASWKARGLDDSLEITARRWATYGKTVREFGLRHPGLVHVVRYEQLVEQPEKVVSAACDFLGLHYDPSMLTTTEHMNKISDLLSQDHMLNAVKPISTNSIGRGRASLSSDELLQLQSIIGPELERSGYLPADAG